jgi:hypothetical protein
MRKLPKVIATTVVRVSQVGEAHGFIYMVDFETDSYQIIYELKKQDILWEGRGGDRGFRGIAQYKDLIYIPIGTELYVFNKDFVLINTYANKYLKDIHEIVVLEDKLYVLSTSFDSIIEFDLKLNKFTNGYLIRRKNNKRFVPSKLDAYFIYWAPDYFYYKLYPFIHPDLKMKNLVTDTFDPNSDKGPIENDTMHLNSISIHDNRISVSGSHTPRMYIHNGSGFVDGPRIPHKTHNTHIIDNKLIFNHTIRNNLVIKDLKKSKYNYMPVVLHDESKLVNNPKDDKLAAHGFARGMTFWDDMVIIGSSPATVTIYSIKTNKMIKSINLSMDTRNSIHGLSVLNPE